MDKQTLSYPLFARYMRQEASAAERQEVEAWLAASADHQEAFDQLVREWEHVYDAPEQAVQADKNLVWQHIVSHIHQTATVIEAQLYTKQALLRIASIAASVALVIGVASAYFVKANADAAFMAQSIATIETVDGQKMQMTLPDGSQVWLNSASKLTYAGDFNRSNRTVTLEGEAFFQVTKDAKKKFIVHTSEVNVVVHGTSFDVSAYREDPEISVSLLAGKVSITDKHGKEMTVLQPNELAIISRNDLRYTLYREDAETYNSWMRGQLIFYHATTQEVARKLERWYGIHIQWENPDTTQYYTFSVKTETLNELLELFNKITPIDYNVNGKEVTIRCR
jgi:ferric-dicitrate binding protein FerR (iron transport regulator)